VTIYTVFIEFYYDKKRTKELLYFISGEELFNFAIIKENVHGKLRLYKKKRDINSYFYLIYKVINELNKVFAANITIKIMIILAAKTCFSRKTCFKKI